MHQLDQTLVVSLVLDKNKEIIKVRKKQVPGYFVKLGHYCVPPALYSFEIKWFFLMNFHELPEREISIHVVD